MATAVASNQSMEVIVALTSEDILLGRGAPLAYFTGNIKFREFVVTRRAEYVATTRHEAKQRIAQELYDELVGPRRARFLSKLDPAVALAHGVTSTTKAWKVAAKDVALEKIKQALREKTDDAKPAARDAAESTGASLAESRPDLTNLVQSPTSPNVASLPWPHALEESHAQQLRAQLVRQHIDQMARGVLVRTQAQTPASTPMVSPVTKLALLHELARHNQRVQLQAAASAYPQNDAYQLLQRHNTLHPMGYTGTAGIANSTPLSQLLPQPSLGLPLMQSMTPHSQNSLLAALLNPAQASMESSTRSAFSLSQQLRVAPSATASSPLFTQDMLECARVELLLKNCRGGDSTLSGSSLPAHLDPASASLLLRSTAIQSNHPLDLPSRAMPHSDAPRFNDVSERSTLSALLRHQTESHTNAPVAPALAQTPSLTGCSPARMGQSMTLGCEPCQDKKRKR